MEEARGKDVLEVGVGTGGIATVVAPSARRFLGVDVSHAMIAEGMREGGYFGVPICADAMQLPVREASVDLVLEHEAFCFLDEPLLGLGESLRVLRPGGRLVRLVSRAREPEMASSLTAQFHRELARRGAGPVPIWGKGADQRINEHLVSIGLDSTGRKLDSWVEQRTLGFYIDRIANRAFPYLQRLPVEVMHAALEAAMQELGLKDQCQRRLTEGRSLESWTTEIPE